MRWFLLLAFALPLAACGTPTWERPGASAEQARVDLRGCEDEAKAAGYPGGGAVANLERQSFVDRCMIRRGYRQTMIYS